VAELVADDGARLRWRRCAHTHRDAPAPNRRRETAFVSELMTAIFFESKRGLVAGFITTTDQLSNSGLTASSTHDGFVDADGITIPSAVAYRPRVCCWSQQPRSRQWSATAMCSADDGGEAH
jgi:hypothetical protein